jgi:CRISPR-associated protein Cas1
MQTLFIDRKNCEVEVDRGRLLVRIEGVRPNMSIPTNLIEILVVSAPINFSSTLLTQLTAEGITTIFINPRKIETCTMTHGMAHNDANRRLLQYQAVSSTEHRLRYSRELVKNKLRAQRAMLIQALRKRPANRHQLTTGIARISGLIESLEIQATIASVRGVEGAAGAAYFEAYQSLFAPSLEFNGRNRRPPRDPVNVILSLSFTLLHADAVRTLFATGFDPLLGVYHTPTFGRESLACDLVESFRPLVEHWVWRLFASQTLRVDHFVMNKDARETPCLLGKAGRSTYYASYAGMAKIWRRLLRRVARHWLQQLQKDFSDTTGKCDRMEIMEKA